MRTLLLALAVVGGTVAFAQAPEPSEIDFTPIPMVVVGVEATVPGTDYQPVIFVDGTSAIPNNSTQIGTFQIQGMTNAKNDRVTLKVYKIQ
jgi:hypothetical protein